MEKTPGQPEKTPVSPSKPENKPASKAPVPAPAPTEKAPAARPKIAFQNDAVPEEVDSYVELPSGYGDHKLVAVVRDPWWIFAYWELSPDKVKSAVEAGGRKGMLRLHDVTGLKFDGTNAHSYRDQEIQFESGSAYLSAWEPDHSYVIELGMADSQGAFQPLLRSSEVAVPRAEPSNDRGQDWAKFSEAMEEIYKLSGGLDEAGKSSRPQFISSLALQIRSSKP